MSKRYPGNFVTGNPVALSQTSNNGIWDVKDNYQATSNGTWQETDGVFEIGKSLRCRYTTTGSLIKNSNLPTPTNPSKWTVSMWVKRGATAYPVTNYYNSLFGKTISASANFAMYFGYSSSDGQDNITWTIDNTYSLQTKQIFRDTSAWYHFVFVWDSNNSVVTERAKIYCNGVLITDYSTDHRSQISSSKDCWNTTNTGYTGAIGATSANSSTPNSSLDGYLAEVHNVDGDCLDPSYFGYFDPVTNIWQPKKYTGTWGNAGGYFPFTDNSSVTNLGKNYAGSNYLLYSQLFTGWTLNNVTVGTNVIAPNGTNTALTLTDNSTLGHHTVYAGSQFASVSGATYTLSCYAKAGTRSVFAIWEPYAMAAFATFDLSTGTITGTGYGGTNPTMQFVGNGWYRCSVSVTTTSTSIGIGLSTATNNTYPGSNYVGSGQTLYIWGAQLNLGSVVDPYIHTVATAKNNDWSTYGISLTAGTTYDSMVDSPTNVFTSAPDIGGVVPGNYCIWNSAVGGGLRAGSVGYTSSIVTLSEGGLTGTFSANGGYSMAMYSMGTMALPNVGKWYWECTNLSNFTTGIFKGQTLPNSGIGGGQEGFIGYSDGGSFIINSPVTGTTTGTALSATGSDIIGVAVDMDGRNIYFYKNGTLMGGITGFTNTNTGANPTSPGSWTTECQLWVPLRGNNTSGSGGTSTTNFGQRPFAHTPPAGYKSLNTTNIQALGTTAVPVAAIQPHKFFDISLFGGSSDNVVVKNRGFQPDLVWTKARGHAQGNSLVTSVTGGAEIQQTNTSAAALVITKPMQFNTDGFTSTTDIHTTGYNYVGWHWKQSPQSGLNIIPYTGNGTTRTISHNLGVVPSMIWLKGITGQASGGAGKWSSNDWAIQHVGMGWKYQMAFNSIAIPESETLNDTPTSSVFTVPSYGQVNTAGNRFLAYVWAEIPGFSKFGSYQANNLVDGDFINTGFRPKFVMVKGSFTANADSWEIWDSARSPIQNGNNYPSGGGTNFSLFPEDNGTESKRDGCQFFANGFKLNAINSRSNNPAGSYYIYMAFAESPHALNNRAK
jgi:hypothetical protein